MTVDGIGTVPSWVLAGVALGVVASVVVAAVFYVGHRLFPHEIRSAGGTPSGDVRRRGEIRAYLTAINERFLEEHAVGGVVVPFYLPARGVAVTFDAHDYFRLEGENVHAVLCEHEMPGRGLGRRLPFDVTEPDWDPDPERSRRSDRVADAYAELGLSTDADADEVKRAYRERVKETHPDRGGDEEAFRRVQEAYATASDHADGEVSGPARPGRSDPSGREDRRRGYGFGR
ncbi:DnaJ domain-containing protein [Halorubrum aquaticum]|uniref:DnaJ domain-containing protein n=1 Tax=Halorubrum aquaticum TaxID=387340 RepID=A0A1I3B3E0_9EURY|nr:J domain-containing protein [Halorubrum aquaticum]SFH56803.1 DnaJ domain-containing protein [Halorubrum aquaticum]